MFILVNGIIFRINLCTLNLIIMETQKTNQGSHKDDSRKDSKTTTGKNFNDSKGTNSGKTGMDNNNKESNSGKTTTEKDKR